MPQHATSTSFKTGHKRSEQSIERQRSTMKQQLAEGSRDLPRKPKGCVDSYKSKECEKCHFIYVPVSGRQRWCYNCVPNKKYRVLLTRYGLSKPDLDHIIERQKGHCALCDSLPIVVDHDHISGKIRGILCYSCNLKLAGLDDFYWKKKAEEYRALSQS